MSELCVCGEPIADCPHLGAFESYEAKALHYRAKPERVAAMKRLDEIGKQAGALAERLRLADAAHDAGSIAEGFGVDVPHRKEITEVVSNVVTFAPYARHLPFIANNPAASTALDVFLAAGRLLLRAITGR